MSAEPWIVLADALLRREALVSRLAEGRPPRDFAGLYVTDDDVAQVLDTLPGLDGPALAQVEAVRAAHAPQIDQAREALKPKNHHCSN